MVAGGDNNLVDDSNPQPSLGIKFEKNWKK